MIALEMDPGYAAWVAGLDAETLAAFERLAAEDEPLTPTQEAEDANRRDLDREAAAE
ncbi:MAG: hypothetical protein LC749_22045 [Actinobacteria bacterium]|nr:hypothetical protein [Actinomycetota bacterium]